MKRYIVAILILAACTVSVPLFASDDGDQSGGDGDSQFAYRETGVMVAAATSSGSGKTTTTFYTSSLSGDDFSIIQTTPSGSGTCAGCMIRGYCYTDIPATHTCCRQWTRCSDIDSCIRAHPVPGVEFPDTVCPVNCGDELIAGDEECEFHDPGTRGTCTGLYQICNSTCHCEEGVPEVTLPPPPYQLRCGNGRVDPGEQCDDNNRIETDECTNRCENARCGDGVVWTGHEQCDDGNAVNDDVCSNTCRLPRCGDGVIQAGESCDGTNLTRCARGATCTTTCTCQYTGEVPPPSPLQCTLGVAGREFILPGILPTDANCCTKDCDLIVGSCPQYQSCASNPDTPLCGVFRELMSVLSDCPVPPRSTPTVPVPPVVRVPPPAVPQACNPNGRPEGTEQCDTFGLEPGPEMEQLRSRCPAAPAGKVLHDCDMTACTCAYIDIPCMSSPIDGTAVQCHANSDCESGKVCDVNCLCGAADTAPLSALPPAPLSPPAPLRSEDCSVEVLSYSSDAARENITAKNAEIAEITGRTDLNVFVEREQMVRVVYVTREPIAASRASATDIGGYGGVAGSPGMTQMDMTNSMNRTRLIQTGGSVFLDFNNPDQMQFKRVELIERPVLILPVNGAQAAAQSLPADLSNAVPMISLFPSMSSSVSSSTDAQVINNMIEHVGFSLGGADTLSFSANGSVEIQAAGAVSPSANTPQMQRNYIDVLYMRIPTGCGSWMALEGYAGCKPIEEQQHNIAGVKDFIRSRVISGEPVKCEVVYGAPWEAIDNFTFILAREGGIPARASSALAGSDTVPVVRFVGGLAVNPLEDATGSGGGCKGCYVNGAGASTQAILPSIIAFFAVIGGIAMGRIKRRS